MKLLCLLLVYLSPAFGQGTCDFNPVTPSADSRVQLSVLDTANHNSAVCGQYAAERSVVHRVFWDASGQPYFGYDLAITHDPATRTFRIVVTRPQASYPVFHNRLGQKYEPITINGAKLRTFSNFPAPSTLADGDRIDLTVLENPKTGARVLDSYVVASAGTAMLPAPKGFERAAISPPGTLLHLDQPTLFHEDNVWGEEPQLGASGPVVWIATKFRGRFLFSATARPDYRRIGLAEGNTIHFSDGAEQYRLALHSGVISTPGTWWIWVKREPDFKPPAADSLLLGAQR